MQGADPLVRVVVHKLAADAVEPLEFEALLRRYANGDQELVPAGGGSLPSLRADEPLTISRPVANDARYAQPVHIVGEPSASKAYITADGERSRNQEREHVRVETTPYDAMLIRPTPEDDEADEEAPEAPPAGRMTAPRRVGTPPPVEEEDDAEPLERKVTVRDISAGGMRVFYDGEPYVAGEVLRVVCELPDEGNPAIDLDLEVQVRWVGPAPYDRQAAGLRFENAERALQRRLTQWVFRHQAKMLRDAKR